MKGFWLPMILSGSLFAGDFLLEPERQVIDLPDYFESIVDLEITEDGSILLVDAKANTIYQMDSEGNVHLAIGRKGEGPGEFNIPYGICLNRGKDSFWTIDYWSTRTFCFSKSGTLHFQGETSWHTHSIAAMPDGGFVLGGRGRAYTLARFDAQGRQIEWFGPKMKDAMRMMRDQLLHRFELATDSLGNIYVAYDHKPVVVSFGPDLKERWKTERFWLNAETDPAPPRLEGMRLIAPRYHLSMTLSENRLYVGTGEEENAILAFDAETGKYHGHRKLDYRPRAMTVADGTLVVVDSHEGRFHLYGGSLTIDKIEKAPDFEQVLRLDENIRVLNTIDAAATKSAGQCGSGANGCQCSSGESGGCKAGCCDNH